MVQFFIFTIANWYSFTVGFPTIKVSVTPRMSPDIFSAIIDFSTSHGKKGKKKGKVITNNNNLSLLSDSRSVYIPVHFLSIIYRERRRKSEDVGCILSWSKEVQQIYLFIYLSFACMWIRVLCPNTLCLLSTIQLQYNIALLNSDRPLVNFWFLITAQHFMFDAWSKSCRWLN